MSASTAEAPAAETPAAEAPAAEAAAAAGADAVASAASGVSALSVDGGAAGAGGGAPPRDPRYPLAVQYCATCSLPPEVHEYLSRSQLDRCADWLRANAPLTFPDRFPAEAAAARAAQHAAAAGGAGAADSAADAAGAARAADADHGPPPQTAGDAQVKVAVPVQQKGTVGKKKKLAPEIVVQVAKRKQKTVTVVYGLDLFGIKLTDATKAAKKKFASGASVARSADNRDVIEIQGTRLEDFAQLAHKAFGIPKKSIFIVDTKKKTKICPFAGDDD